MSRLILLSPLDGWALPLQAVCDPVFSQGMAGDGVAIDPTGDVLCAPCDGEVLRPGAAAHALSLRHDSGLEVLLHVGIDTVALQGMGFELLMPAGARVRAGTPLLRFDLDRIARAARSAVTPVLIASGGSVLHRVAERSLRVGDTLMEVEVAATAAPGETSSEEQRRRFRVPFDHGLHARPAAQLVAALRPFASDVRVLARGREANARSTVSLMSLGVQSGDEVEIVGRGTDAAQALEALATLLATVVSPPVVAVVDPPRSALKPTRLSAVVAARGLAIGPAVVLRHTEPVVNETGAGYRQEQAALLAARNAVAERLQDRMGRVEPTQREVLEAHLALLQDPELLRAADAWLQRGKSAGHAWQRALQASAEAFAALGDARMNERAADLRDLERQVLQALVGDDAPLVPALPEHALVIADELLSSQLCELDLTRVAGIAMARGGPTSHVALLAAAHGIPTLVAAGPALLAVEPGTTLILDAEQGVIAVAPSDAERHAVQTRLQEHAARERADMNASTQTAVTRDGTAVAIHANLGAEAEVATALQRGAEGCGLLRTEFLFLERNAAPNEDEQARAYVAVAAGFGTRPVTIRTLDIGGDKPLAYLPLPREENPVLGLRGLRVSLREPALLRTQMRALLRAAEQGRVRVMLPMVNDLMELQAARAIWEQAASELGMSSRPPLGVMIETPAAALLADQLAAQADFLSIGSNDLSQYVLAVDRGHAELAAQLDALHPAVLRLIAQIVVAAKRHGRSVSICGGLGSDLEATPLLLGLGLRELSALPATIPRLKRRVRELDLSACEALARQALECTSAAAVRALVAAADRNAVPVDVVDAKMRA